MKKRLDILIFERGLAPSRERARALIMEGSVLVNGAPAAKAGMLADENAPIEVRENAQPFVSRGGLKLQKALEAFGIGLSGAVCADVGASTGGFTDCMLKHGAARVYAIDVGYGQLDWRLRSDARVTVMERTNARGLSPDWFDGPLGFASVDVSFISLKLILPPLRTCLAQNASVVALIKPQFEAGRAQVGKNGVVRDAAVHEAVCGSILAFAHSTGYGVRELTFSPVTGPKGNVEFLVWLTSPKDQNQQDAPYPADRIQDVVSQAHNALL